MAIYAAYSQHAYIPPYLYTCSFMQLFSIVFLQVKSFKSRHQVKVFLTVEQLQAVVKIPSDQQFVKYSDRLAPATINQPL